MPARYEKIVLEDLNLGTGTVPVTMPAGGTAIGTQINAANLGITLSTLDAQRQLDYFHVEDPAYGAVGDGTTDDVAAIQAAIEAADAAGGGKVVFRAGATYALGSTLAFDDLQWVTLEGNGAKLKYTAAGTGYAVTFYSSLFITVRDLEFIYSNPAYTGDLVYTGWSSASTDPSYTTFEHCYFHGTPGSAVSANSLLRLNRAIFTSVRDCQFGYANYGVWGQSPSYSNVTALDHCTFFSINTMAVYNAGEAWDIRNCTGEALSSGRCGFYSQDASLRPRALNIDGCWFGDVTAAGGGQWIFAAALGLRITGCNFGSPGGGASDVCIRLNGSQGIYISANHNETATTFLDFSGSCFGATVLANNVGIGAIGNQGNCVQLFGRGNYNIANIG